MEKGITVFVPTGKIKNVSIRGLYALVAVIFWNVGIEPMFDNTDATVSVGEVSPVGVEIVSRDLNMIDLIPSNIRDEFRDSVISVADRLDIEPDWLMAVMWSESRFDPKVFNRKGSGAVGLIQWVEPTARELGTSTREISRMGMVEQMEYVYKYLEMVKSRYGAYESLTDLYLGILYPKARKYGYCYTLYANPSIAYTQNKGLDQDKDGKVTVHDIDIRMRRLFKSSY